MVSMLARNVPTLLALVGFLLVLLASPSHAFTEVFSLTKDSSDNSYYVGNQDSDFFIGKRDQSCGFEWTSTAGSTSGDDDNDENEEILYDVAIGSDDFIYAVGSTRGNFDSPTDELPNLDAALVVYDPIDGSAVRQAQYDIAEGFDNTASAVVQKPDGNLLVAVYGSIPNVDSSAVYETRLLQIDPSSLSVDTTYAITVTTTGTSVSGGPKMLDFIYDELTDSIVALGHILGRGLLWRYSLSNELVSSQAEWGDVFRSFQISGFTTDGADAFFVVGSSPENVLENLDLTSTVSSEFHAYVIRYDLLTEVTTSSTWVRQLNAPGSSQSGNDITIDPVTQELVVIGGFDMDFEVLDSQTLQTFQVSAVTDSGLTDIFIWVLKADTGDFTDLKISTLASTASEDRANAVQVLSNRRLDIGGVINDGTDENPLVCDDSTLVTSPSPSVTVSLSATGSPSSSPSTSSFSSPSASASPSSSVSPSPSPSASKAPLVSVSPSSTSAVSSSILVGPIASISGRPISSPSPSVSVVLSSVGTPTPSPFISITATPSLIVASPSLTMVSVTPSSGSSVRPSVTEQGSNAASPEASSSPTAISSILSIASATPSASSIASPSETAEFASVVISGTVLPIVSATPSTSSGEGPAATADLVVTTVSGTVLPIISGTPSASPPVSPSTSAEVVGGLVPGTMLPIVSATPSGSSLMTPPAIATTEPEELSEAVGPTPDMEAAISPFTTQEIELSAQPSLWTGFDTSSGPSSYMEILASEDPHPMFTDEELPSVSAYPVGDLMVSPTALPERSPEDIMTASPQGFPNEDVAGDLYPSSSSDSSNLQPSGSWSPLSDEPLFSNAAVPFATPDTIQERPLKVSPSVGSDQTPDLFPDSELAEAGETFAPNDFAGPSSLPLADASYRPSPEDDYPEIGGPGPKVTKEPPADFTKEPFEFSMWPSLEADETFAPNDLVAPSSTPRVDASYQPSPQYEYPEVDGPGARATMEPPADFVREPLEASMRTSPEFTVSPDFPVYPSPPAPLQITSQPIPWEVSPEPSAGEPLVPSWEATREPSGDFQQGAGDEQRPSRGPTPSTSVAVEVSPTFRPISSPDVSSSVTPTKTPEPSGLLQTPVVTVVVTASMSPGASESTRPGPAQTLAAVTPTKTPEPSGLVQTPVVTVVVTASMSPSTSESTRPGPAQTLAASSIATVSASPVVSSTVTSRPTGTLGTASTPSPTETAASTSTLPSPATTPPAETPTPTKTPNPTATDTSQERTPNPIRTPTPTATHPSQERTPNPTETPTPTATYPLQERTPNPSQIASPTATSLPEGRTPSPTSNPAPTGTYAAQVTVTLPPSFSPGNNQSPSDSFAEFAVSPEPSGLEIEPSTSPETTHFEPPSASQTNPAVSASPSFSSQITPSAALTGGVQISVSASAQPSEVDVTPVITAEAPTMTTIVLPPSASPIPMRPTPTMMTTTSPRPSRTPVAVPVMTVHASPSGFPVLTTSPQVGTIASPVSSDDMPWASPEPTIFPTYEPTETNSPSSSPTPSQQTVPVFPCDHADITSDPKELNHTENFQRVSMLIQVAGPNLTNACGLTNDIVERFIMLSAVNTLSSEAMWFITSIEDGPAVYSIQSSLVTIEELDVFTELNDTSSPSPSPSNGLTNTELYPGSVVFGIMAYLDPLSVQLAEGSYVEYIRSQNIVRVMKEEGFEDIEWTDMLANPHVIDIRSEEAANQAPSSFASEYTPLGGTLFAVIVAMGIFIFKEGGIALSRLGSTAVRPQPVGDEMV